MPARSPGEPRPDDTETKAARWVDLSELPTLKIYPAMRRRIDDAIAGHPGPQIV